MKLSIWIYGPGIGWWLHEEGYDNWTDASAGLADAVENGPPDWVGGAVVPDGGFPMPMCESCMTRPKVAEKPGDVKRGDIVEFNGKRYVALHRDRRGMWFQPANKAGTKPDQRQELQILDPDRCRKVGRSE